MAAIFTKFAWLHPLFILCICSFVMCTLPSLPDSTATGHNLMIAIVEYVKAGYKYSTILSLLSLYHATQMSLSTLKRILRRMHIRRRNIDVPPVTIRDAIQRELDGPGSLAGYRQMWQTLRQDYGLVVPRGKVMELLRQMDPLGTARRKRHRLQRRVYRNKGPNYVWHVDGYDKLRPYGFEIHGCIDGYSRRIMWLEVGSSNKDPKIVCGYYIKCLQQIGGCPRVVRTDPGTENVLLASVQCTLRRDGLDELAGTASHRYGKSVFNQRIEAWWSHYKRNRSEWWINKFKELSEFGALDIGSEHHLKCLRFCFMDLLQEDLDRVVTNWNNHTIRATRSAECPHGIPNILYLLAGENGTRDYKCPVSEEDTTWALSMCTLATSKTGHDYVDEDLKRILRRDGLRLPTNWEEAIQTYFHLLDSL